MALRSWVMVKVNSWGNKWESWRGREERKGSDARDLMRGKGEGDREWRREEIKARAHLSMSIGLEKYMWTRWKKEEEKNQAALIKGFPSQANNNAARLNASWCQTFYSGVPSLEILLPDPPPTHAQTHTPLLLSDFCFVSCRWWTQPFSSEAPSLPCSLVKHSRSASHDLGLGHCRLEPALCRAEQELGVKVHMGGAERREKEGGE